MKHARSLKAASQTATIFGDVGVATRPMQDILDRTPRAQTQPQGSHLGSGVGRILDGKQVAWGGGLTGTGNMG